MLERDVAGKGLFPHAGGVQHTFPWKWPSSVAETARMNELRYVLEFQQGGQGVRHGLHVVVHHPDPLEVSLISPLHALVETAGTPAVTCRRRCDRCRNSS